jgi:hypothetical protein
MTTHNTGVRSFGRELAWYCNMRREWVPTEERDSCSDLERPDSTEEHEEQERCRHSSSHWPEQKEETGRSVSGLDNETDE